MVFPSGFNKPGGRGRKGSQGKSDFPGPRGRPDLKNTPNKSGQIALRHPIGVKYLKFDFYLRAKLECRVSGTVWLLIWWISGGVRPPGAVAI
jgi:hypothetical protein